MSDRRFPGLPPHDPDGPVDSPRVQGWQPRQTPDHAASHAAPEAVAGDVVLTADVATTDLSAAASARMGGRAIALAGVVVVAGVVLARLLGWLRTVVFFCPFGAGARLHSFLFAFRIPDALFQLVAAGAVGSALVPVASGWLANGGPERARRLIATVTNLM